MNMEITASVKLSGGKAICEKNLSRIKAIGLEEYSGVYFRRARAKGYPVYVATKEAEGYIFRDERFAFGISGHYKTLRALVIATLITDRFKVVVQ